MFFLEFWKRKEVTLAYHWDVLEYEEEEVTTILILFNYRMLIFSKTPSSIKHRRWKQKITVNAALNKRRIQSDQYGVYSRIACEYALLLGTSRSGDGDGSKNVAEKVNSRSFNLPRDYSTSLTLSNVG